MINPLYEHFFKAFAEAAYLNLQKSEGKLELNPHFAGEFQKDSP